MKRDLIRCAEFRVAERVRLVERDRFPRVVVLDLLRQFVGGERLTDSLRPSVTVE